MTHANPLSKRYGGVALCLCLCQELQFHVGGQVRSKSMPGSRRFQVAGLQFAPYNLKVASVLRGRQHSKQVSQHQVCQRQVAVSRCQMSFKRLIPAMAQRRTGLSDCTAANQRQPDTRHVLSREQAIQVYDRQVICDDETKTLRFF